MGQKLGQHFLKDTKILEATRDAIQYFWDREENIGSLSLLEIGPGKGALTKYIKDISDDFVVVEKDEGMKPYLKKILSEEQIVWGDVLNMKSDENSDDHRSPARYNLMKKMVVVGNLPYYITSPILRKFFETSPPIPPLLNAPRASSLGEGGETDFGVKIVGGVFLIQKEVADKVKTDARKKSYLRWLLNFAYKIEYLFTVPPESFSPPPKVESVVIRLTLREKIALSDDGAYEKMTVFLDIVSGYKRKTLGKIEKMRKEDLHALGIETPEELKGKRLEELGWEEMGMILKNDTSEYSKSSENSEENYSKLTLNLD